MLQILLCEDEEIYCQLIKEQLIDFSIRHDIEYQLEIVHTSKELLQISNKYDIVLLDVQLENESNSIEVAEKLRENGLSAIIVIITSFEQYSLEGYKIHAHRFLLKPIKQEELDEALLSSIKELHQAESRIEVICDYEKRIFLIRDIIYIESYGRKRKLHLPYGCFETNTSFQDFLQKLPKEEFDMPQKSFIVNFRHVVRFSKSSLIMDNDKQISLSRNRTSDFMLKFHHFIRSGI